MKIYTKTGDHGETGLFGGPRVRKDHPRIEAFGEVDELNSMLGLARAADLPAEVEVTLLRVQHELFSVGSELASPHPEKLDVPQVGDQEAALLEEAIDQLEGDLEPLTQFILPSGCEASVRLQVARTICRRAERSVVTLIDRAEVEVSERLVRYLNRLSDYLFVAARFANQRAGIADQPWQKPGGSGAC
jgi:cob(I)alamin adenosyltransferase